METTDVSSKEKDLGTSGPTRPLGQEEGHVPGREDYTRPRRLGRHVTVDPDGGSRTSVVRTLPCICPMSTTEKTEGLGPEKWTKMVWWTTTPTTSLVDTIVYIPRNVLRTAHHPGVVP